MSPHQYGLVFDAGSSHTSLFVYQWPMDKENNTGVVSQTFTCNVNGSGISSYASNPPEAGASLRECLNEAMAVLEEVGKTIRQYPVSFQGARIITGEDEGAYGWITINYLLNSFTQYSAKDQDWIHPTSANILGALDLGGASTQISFVPAGHIADPAEAIQFRLYGPCAKQPEVPMVRKNVTLVGTGNATLCRETVKKIFNFSHCSHNQSCSFNGVYQPKVNGKFLAFSAYYYTFSFLNLTETHPLATVEAAIQAFCARKWDELKVSYPKQRTDRLRNYCASANYILTLLLDGYGFSNTTWENIAFRMQAANSDIGWTLGYMLNLTNMIPSEAPQLLRGHEEGTWVASIFFIAATLALCIILLVIYFLR
ncbi:hypothetical protein JD844_004789 [Phrynosoma platyrhinos]|uniref:Ectonucleoside triphosphate diphosphohydrolase 8 n=1 Tax=Phrynosoma platyrhinos TaxID=52577 RepID=A0ABQ7SDU0_PHRPL|nr:hypothetical protein JD844_004789 [Phrynosoma platyrhinos]